MRARICSNERTVYISMCVFAHVQLCVYVYVYVRVCVLVKEDERCVC